MSEQKEERTKLRSMETNREQVRNQDKHDGEQQTQTKQRRRRSYTWRTEGWRPAGNKTQVKMIKTIKLKTRRKRKFNQIKSKTGKTEISRHK